MPVDAVSDVSASPKTPGTSGARRETDAERQARELARGFLLDARQRVVEAVARARESSDEAQARVRPAALARIVSRDTSGLTAAEVRAAAEKLTGEILQVTLDALRQVEPDARDGVYLVEDLHTSYWEEYGGGYKAEGSFIEYAKDLVDQLHGWHRREEPAPVTDYTRSIRGLHIYDSVVVLDKEVVGPPDVQKTGKESF